MERVYRGPRRLARPLCRMRRQACTSTPPAGSSRPSIACVRLATQALRMRWSRDRHGVRASFKLAVTRRLAHGHNDQRHQAGRARTHKDHLGLLGGAGLDAVPPRVVEEAVVRCDADRVRRWPADHRGSPRRREPWTSLTVRPCDGRIVHEVNLPPDHTAFTAAAAGPTAGGEAPSAGTISGRRRRVTALLRRRRRA